MAGFFCLYKLVPNINYYNMKKMTYPQSLASEHRHHIITAAEATKIANHFIDAEIDKGEDGAKWEAKDFEGKSIYEVGCTFSPVLSHSNGYIHGIICLLFDYERIG